MSQASLQEESRTTATPRQGVTLANVIRSEWIKFHTLKSMIITLIVAGLVEVVFAALLALMGDSNYTGVLAMGGQLAQVPVAVMAVLAITGEYSSMSIRSTLTAVPTRLPVLYAKLIVVAVATFVTMAVFTLAAGGVVWLVAHNKVSTETPIAFLDGYLAIVIVFTGISALCFLIGAIVRSTSGTLGICIGLIFVPLVLNIYAGFSNNQVVADFTRFLPFAGLNKIANYGFETHFRPWYYGSAIGWVVVLGIIATWLFKKRDA